MKSLKNTILLTLMLLCMGATAQTRSVKLTVTVTSVPGDNLENQPVTLVQTDYSAEYPGVKLDASGACTVNVYPGNHSITVVRDGFDTVKRDFTVTETPTEQQIALTLTEKTRQPFGLTAELRHNAMTGRDDLAVTWNTEAPVFFDDFESYDPFAIEFGQWTGIDADGEATAPLLGSYPNRGVMQYAQIINPLAVTPTWWYDYPILRPYSGQQYVGFVRTSSGNANDDWLISPVITPGSDNVFEFKAKAADRWPERFMVYVTTVTDNPTTADFVRIDKNNYETADYTGWKTMSYDLSAYAGVPVRMAIRYISDTNRYGAFMLMVDDVYVGQPRVDTDDTGLAALSTARRVGRRSPANSNETFEVYLDGTLAGTTDGYSYLLTDVAAGTHTIGVKARYLQAESSMSTVTAEVPTGIYSALTITVTADSKLGPDGQTVELVNTADAVTYTLTVADGKAVIPSLPYGTYEVHIAEGAFSQWNSTIEVSEPETALNIALTDNIIAPWNITATQSDNGDIEILWNQNLGFTDSFEDYDDFATGEFGEWLSVDKDRLPVYPIALGSQTNIVTFPGSGSAENPTAIPPMVFNPWKTVPAMLPTDPAIAAPDGDKTVIFFSPQMAMADKWLISPEIEIRNNYEFSVVAKAYSSMYPESIELCVSEDSTNPADFIVLAQVDRLTAEEWSQYSTSLDEYAGKTVRVAIHYTAYDAFLTQVDMVSVGPAEGETDIIDYGNVVCYEIYLDGTKVGTSETPGYTLEGVPSGRHTVGIKSIYLNGASEMSEYVIDVAGIIGISADTTEDSAAAMYDISGRPVNPSNVSQGIYLSVKNGKTTKIIIK